MVKKGFFRRCTALVLSALIGLSTLTVDPEMVEAKQTVYKEDELLYWRFDEGGEEQTILIRTENVPVNLTYTHPINDEALPYDADTTYYMDDNAGSLNSYGRTLYKAGIITDVNPEDHAVVFYKDDEHTQYDVWGVQPYDIRSNIKYYHYTINAAGAEEPFYVYDGSFFAGKKLPDVITNQEVLSYKINYDGNAILVPVDSIDYCTDVQGKIVDVSSDDNVKLEFAIEKAGTGASKANYKLSCNTVTVRLEAEYKYTRLVPLSGEYNEKQYNGGLTPEWATRFGKYGLIPSSKVDFPKPLYNGSGTRVAIESYGEYQSIVNDYVNGGLKTVYSSCPVTSVEETVKYYKDVECYIIDTNEIRANGKDANVFLKDFRKSNIVTEPYKFVKSNGSFSVKYSYKDGFTVKGISRNTDLAWINGTIPSQSISGFDGEVIEWWVGGSTIHYYTTPEKINYDIDVSKFMDNGSTLFFCDANKPDKVVKVKIPARAKAPSISFKKEKDGTIILDGLVKGKTAIRLCGTDKKYLALPVALLSGDGERFDSTYYADNDTVTAKNGDPVFYLYSKKSSKTDTVKLNDFFGIAENKNLHVIPGVYIEAQTKATEKKAGSAVSALYINDQPIFNVSASASLESIVIKEGSIKICDAEKNNTYEYAIMGVDGSISNWKQIAASKEKKVSEITDGVTICIRKKATKTNDKSLFLPSTYIKLVYNGQGVGVPNAYYMSDYVTASSESIELVNDTMNTVKINGTSVLPYESYTVDGVYSYTTYSVSNGKLVKDLNLAMCVQGKNSAGSIMTADIDSNRFALSEICGNNLKEVDISYADYASNASKTSSFTYTCGKGGHTSHTQYVGAMTPDDTAVAANQKTVTIEGVNYNYYPINLLRYMVNDN